MELYDVLDQIDQVIYLSDLDTHEIIFVNRYGKKQYGPVTPGVKCYEYLQGFAIPGTGSCPARATCCSTTASSR